MNLWPIVAPLLQARYREARMAYIDEAARLGLMTPWPKRRTSKRKPVPGTLEALEVEG